MEFSPSVDGCNPEGNDGPKETGQLKEVAFSSAGNGRMKLCGDPSPFILFWTAETDHVLFFLANHIEAASL